MHATIHRFDRVVVVEMSNPLMETISGRMWSAEQLIQRGLISLPQEFLTVAQTGNLDPLLSADDAQLARIHSENEMLARGETPTIDVVVDNLLL